MNMTDSISPELNLSSDSEEINKIENCKIGLKGEILLNKVKTPEKSFSTEKFPNYDHHFFADSNNFERTETLVKNFEGQISRISKEKQKLNKSLDSNTIIDDNSVKEQNVLSLFRIIR